MPTTSITLKVGGLLSGNWTRLMWAFTKQILIYTQGFNKCLAEPNGGWVGRVANALAVPFCDMGSYLGGGYFYTPTSRFSLSVCMYVSMCLYVCVCTNGVTYLLWPSSSSFPYAVLAVSRDSFHSQGNRFHQGPLCSTWYFRRVILWQLTSAGTWCPPSSRRHCLSFSVSLFSSSVHIIKISVCLCLCHCFSLCPCFCPFSLHLLRHVFLRRSSVFFHFLRIILSTWLSSSSFSPSSSLIRPSTKQRFDWRVPIKEEKRQRSRRRFDHSASDQPSFGRAQATIESAICNWNQAMGY